MKIVPNIQFICLVKCEGKQREFNFRKRNTTDTPYYRVDTVDLAGTRFQFNMDVWEDGWVIRESELPSWILNAEPQLSLRITDHGG